MLYTIKSINGNGKLYKIRKAIENKKHWVVEVFFDNRDYPNIISGRFSSLKLAKEAVSNSQTRGSDFLFWGDIDT